ncbi:hypothetical protein BH20VER2_BH20VER2_11770 [soil metagenome]
MNAANAARLLLPLWAKIAWTVFTAALVPIYWWWYGPANFLWFSDVALFASVVVIWTRARLLASAMTVAVLLPELLWNVEFLVRLLTGQGLTGLTDYMWDESIPWFVRAISLFHIPLLVLLVWSVYRLGYDRRGWLAATLLAVVLLPVTRLLSGSDDNINWVYGPGNEPQEWMPGWLYVAALVVFFPTCVYAPTHFLLRRLCGRPQRDHAG